MSVYIAEDDEIWFGLISELFKEVDTCCLTDEDVLRYYRMFKAYEQEQRAKRRTEQLNERRKSFRVILGGKVDIPADQDGKDEADY